MPFYVGQTDSVGATAIAAFPGPEVTTSLALLPGNLIDSEAFVAGQGLAPGQLVEDGVVVSHDAPNFCRCRGTDCGHFLSKFTPGRSRLKLRL